MERYNEVCPCDIDPQPKKSQKPRPKKETIGKPKLSKIFEVKDTKPPKAEWKAERKECKCKGKKTCGGYVKRKEKAKKKV